MTAKKNEVLEKCITIQLSRTNGFTGSTALLQLAAFTQNADEQSDTPEAFTLFSLPV